jgi:hypothetical protein
MDIEHDVKVLTIDDKFESKLKELQAEGWTLVAGVLPIAIYHVVRQKQPPAGVGFGKLQVDDTKVMILKPDGSLQ